MNFHIPPAISEKINEYILEKRLSKYDVQITKVTKHNFGYVFYLTPKKYMLTGNIKDAVPGINPVIYDTFTENLIPISSSVHPKQVIAKFEKKYENFI